MAFARLSGKPFSEFAKGMEEKRLKDEAETNDRVTHEGGDQLNILKDIQAEGGGSSMNADGPADNT